MDEYIVKNEEETIKVASLLASKINGGELIFAKGDLGVGKTFFFKALGKALGVKRVINSPTFNLIKIYDGKIKNKALTLYHVDCYRLEGVDEKRKDLGLDEVIGESDKLVYVEWPEYADEYTKNYLPRIEIDISYISEFERRIVVNYEK